MSIFLAGFVALIILALLLLLPTLFRRTASASAGSWSPDGRRANLSVLREQLAALDAELAAGTLDGDQHRVARTEIERRALEEEQGVERPAVEARAGKTAWALGISIPLFVVVVYGLLGNPQALAPPPQAAASAPAGEVTAAQIEAMVDKLAKRMEGKATAEAGDAQGWLMLARSYAVLQRYPEASRAYARARALSPEDAQLLADHADVLAMTQGQSLVGEPIKLVQRALQLDPKNLKALALAGSAAFERKDFAGALKYWVQAQQLAPPGSEFATGLENSIQQARAAGGADGATVAAAASVEPARAGAAATASAGAGEPAAQADGLVAGQISGVVQLAASLAGKVAPTDTVFIFARAAQGPRMPLAILKRKAGDLPLGFTLDDSSAMSPDLKLSKFPNVVLGARVSRSGDAMPQSGDLVGQIGPIATGSGKVTLTIDSVQP